MGVSSWGWIVFKAVPMTEILPVFTLGTNTTGCITSTAFVEVDAIPFNADVVFVFVCVIETKPEAPWVRAFAEKDNDVSEASKDSAKICFFMIKSFKLTINLIHTIVVGIRDSLHFFNVLLIEWLI